MAQASPTGAEILDWIEQHADDEHPPLSDWQKTLVRDLFDNRTTAISLPKRTGRTSLVRSIERAVDALHAS